jgi:hypothetical protein
MKRSMTRSTRLRKLELRQESVAVLSNTALREVGGGGHLRPHDDDKPVTITISVLNSCP